MQPIFILRHRKERLSKCSLRGLENQSNLRFFSYPAESDALVQQLLALPPPICLAPNAVPLTKEDLDRPIVLLDATWRLAQKLFRAVDEKLKDHWQVRALPRGLKTAYPRRQSDCPEPGTGLASIEALAIVQHLIGQDGLKMLCNYRWREKFIEENFEFFEKPANGSFCYSEIAISLESSSIKFS